MDAIRSKSSRASAGVTPYADDRTVFVKPFAMEGRNGYAIHAADGSPIGWCENRDVAFAAARQQNLDPVSVH